MRPLRSAESLPSRAAPLLRGTASGRQRDCVEPRSHLALALIVVCGGCSAILGADFDEKTLGTSGAGAAAGGGTSTGSQGATGGAGGAQGTGGSSSASDATASSVSAGGMGGGGSCGGCVLTFPVEADATLDAGNPDQNNSRALLLHALPSPGEQTALLRFGGLTGAAPTGVLAAALFLKTGGVSGCGSELSFALHQVLEPWAEGEVTWNTRTGGLAWASPGAGAPPSSSSAVVGTVSPTAIDTVYEVDVDTALVADWITGAQVNNGLVIVADGPIPDGVCFRSSEGPAPPYLEVTFACCPDP